MNKNDWQQIVSSGEEAPDISSNNSNPAGSNLDCPLHFVTVSGYGFIQMLRCLKMNILGVAKIKCKSVCVY